MSELIEFLNPPVNETGHIDCTWSQGQSKALTEFIKTHDQKVSHESGAFCCRASSIKVDGAWYCGTHAKAAALRYLINNQFKITKT